jgi:hypothetical protein
VQRVADLVQVGDAGPFRIADALNVTTISAAPMIGYHHGLFGQLTLVSVTVVIGQWDR